MQGGVFGCSSIPISFILTNFSHFLQCSTFSSVFYSKSKYMRIEALSCDTSAYGFDAVLAHMVPDGTGRLIEYASSVITLKLKEWLSCIFGVTFFYQYCFGHCSHS